MELLRGLASFLRFVMHGVYDRGRARRVSLIVVVLILCDRDSIRVEQSGASVPLGALRDPVALGVRARLRYCSAPLCSCCASKCFCRSYRLIVSHIVWLRLRRLAVPMAERSCTTMSRTHLREVCDIAQLSFSQHLRLIAQGYLFV